MGSGAQAFRRGSEQSCWSSTATEPTWGYVLLRHAVRERGMFEYDLHSKPQLKAQGNNMFDWTHVIIVKPPVQFHRLSKCSLFILRVHRCDFGYSFGACSWPQSTKTEPSSQYAPEVLLLLFVYCRIYFFFFFAACLSRCQLSKCQLTDIKHETDTSPQPVLQNSLNQFLLN